MPLASRALSTVGLWTRSPRIVRGPASACSSASAMASRTPKHMPRWAARRIRILYGAKYTATQISVKSARGYDSDEPKNVKRRPEGDSNAEEPRAHHEAPAKRGRVYTEHFVS